MTEPYVPAMIRAYREQSVEDPTNPMSFYSQAIERRDCGDLSGWRQAMEHAFTLPHRTLQQRYCRAWAKLTLGDWTGWDEYEVRSLMPDESSPYTTLAEWIRWTHELWDGIEDLSDKTLLVLSEQGEGDNIQMLRYIPTLCERARQVIVVSYPRLVPIVQANFGKRVTVTIRGVDKPLQFDRYVRIMSLPKVIGCLPPFVPLRSPGRRVRLGDRQRPIRAGVCWAGNPDYADDARRSMPAAHLTPLLERTDVDWYSLQVGGRAADADRFPAMIRPWPPLITFGDTADLMTELDLVVAVDTAVAHLAGSLGIPTYLLLPFRSEWRWGLQTTTPWYPTMSLVRQPMTGDWDGAVAALQVALDNFESASSHTLFAAAT